MMRNEYYTGFKPSNIFDAVHNNQYEVFNYTTANPKYGSGTVAPPETLIYPTSGLAF